MTRSRRRRRGLAIAAAAVVAWMLALWLVPWIRVAAASRRPSQSMGSTSSGRLVNGKPVPPSGPGFRTYSRLGSALGRQYLHGAARDALVASFAVRARAEPGRVFVVAETGWRKGGRLRPHRTHRNGLSVDVLMPMVEDGRPACLSTAPWHELGYGHELDAEGRLPGTDAAVDFESLAAWLRELDAQARERGLRVERIIVAPEYVPKVERRLGPLSAALLRTPAWIRHDEHVHVDFALAR